MLDAAENSVQPTPYPKTNGGSLMSEPLNKIGVERKISNTEMATFNPKTTNNNSSYSQGQALYKSSPHLTNPKTGNSYSHQNMPTSGGAVKHNGPVEGICVGESFDRAIERYLLSPHTNGPGGPDQDSSGPSSAGHAIFPFMPLGMRQMQAKFMKHNKTTHNSNGTDGGGGACSVNTTNPVNSNVFITQVSSLQNNIKNNSFKRSAPESQWAPAPPQAKKFNSNPGLNQYQPNSLNATTGTTSKSEQLQHLNPPGPTELSQQQQLQLQQQQQQQAMGPLDVSYPHYLYAYYQQLYLYQQAQLAASINQGPPPFGPDQVPPAFWAAQAQTPVNGGKVSNMAAPNGSGDSLNRMNSLVSSSIYTTNNVKNMYDQLTTTTTTKSPLTPALLNSSGKCSRTTPNSNGPLELSDKTTKDIRSRSALRTQAPGTRSPAAYNGVASFSHYNNNNGIPPYTSQTYSNPGCYLGTFPPSSQSFQPSAGGANFEGGQQYHNAKPKIFQNYLDSPLAAVDDHFKESLNKQSSKKATPKEGPQITNYKNDPKMGVRQLMYNSQPPHADQQSSHLGSINSNNHSSVNTSLNYNNSKASKPIPTNSAATGLSKSSIKSLQQQQMAPNGSTSLNKPFYDLYMQYLKDMLSNNNNPGPPESSTTISTNAIINNEEPLNLITGLRGQTTPRASTNYGEKVNLMTSRQAFPLPPPSTTRTLEQNYNLTLQTFIEQAVHVAFGYEKDPSPTGPNNQTRAEGRAQNRAQPKKLKQQWLHKHISDNNDRALDGHNSESQKLSPCNEHPSISIVKSTAPPPTSATSKPLVLHQNTTEFAQQSPPQKTTNDVILPSGRSTNNPKPVNQTNVKVSTSSNSSSQGGAICGATCYDFDDYSPPPIQLTSHHPSAMKNKSPTQPPSTTPSSSSQCTPPSSVSGGGGSLNSAMPTEPFLQYEPCNSLSPKLPKCWECRLSPSQRNQRLNIFCRFYAFRKLKINAKGTYSVAGFSETYEATGDDLKIWLPAKGEQSPATSQAPLDQPGFNLGSGLDLKVTCLYIFRFTLPYFVALIKQEEKALEAVSGNSKIAWKRPVEGIREMCDACQTTLFNRHWVCPKCGFAVCLDCYIGKKKWLEKSLLPPPPSANANSSAFVLGSGHSNGESLIDLKENVIKNIFEPTLNVCDDFPWLPCTNRQPHEPTKLMATHIIPNIALTEIVQVCEKLVDKYKFHNLLQAPIDNPNYQAKDIKRDDAPLNGIRKEIAQKLNNVNGFNVGSSDRGKLNNGLKPNNSVSRSLTTICQDVPEISRDSVSLIDFKDQNSSNNTGGPCKNRSNMAPKDRLRLDVATNDLSTNASPLSWLADVALSTSARTLSHCEDSNTSKTKDQAEHRDQQPEPPSFDIVDHLQNSSKVTNPFLASPKNYFKNLTPSNTLDDVITAVIEQTIAEPIDSDAELKSYRNYCQKSANTSCSTSSSSCPSSIDSPPCDSLESSNCCKPVPLSTPKPEPSHTVIKQENVDCDDVPHSWICGGRVLHLQHRHQTPTPTPAPSTRESPLPYRGKLLAKFCETWSSGAPVLVSGIHKSLDSALWNPDWFSRAFGQFEHDFINCRRNTCIKNLKMKGFWEGFTHYHKRMKDELSNNEPMILKLKDWPSSDDFSEILPKHYKDLSQALPLPEYTQRAGLFNLASRLPQAFVKPDLGPKMYNAYGSALHPTEGSTNLHIDISDATNILAYVGIPLDEPGQDYYFDWGEQHPGDIKTEGAGSAGSRKPKLFSRSIWQAILEAGPDADSLDRLKRGIEVPGAIWHIYKACDAPKIRQFLIMLALETGKDVMAHHDPIHDQEAYITYEMNQRLRREYGVEPYTIVQCLGDAIFIPAGAPHQVRNLYSCIKIAEDFVSPEHVGHCLRLTEEFRKLSDTHANHEDKLQIKNIIYHTVKDVCAILNGTMKIGDN